MESITFTLLANVEFSQYSKSKLRIFVVLRTYFAIILNRAACGITFPKLYFQTGF